MKSSKINLISLMMFLMIFFPFTNSVNAIPTTGVIYGKVSNDLGYNLSGITVTILQEGLPGRWYTIATTVTNFKGNYYISNLHFDIYKVKATLPSTIKYEYMLDYIQYYIDIDIPLMFERNFVFNHDTVEPTVDIVSPSGGSYIDNIINIEVEANDNRIVTEVEFFIDEIYLESDTSLPYECTVDTSSYNTGDTITIKAEAIDGYNNVGYNQITITVDHEAPIVTLTSPTYLETISKICSIEVTVNDNNLKDVLFYIDYELIYTDTNYPYSFNWNTTEYNDNEYNIKVIARDYTGHSNYDTTNVTVANKYALIVGISDYKYLSSDYDLQFCDDDATDWYNYLNDECGFRSSNIHVLGDGHNDNYPKYTNDATEANIRAELQWLASLDCEEIVFVSSGHGGGSGYGSSYILAYESGKLYDTEIATDLSNVLANKVFIFLDHCYSGGIISEVSNVIGDKLFMTTTSTENGVGYDSSDFNNGVWTYFFLDACDPDISLELAYNIAYSNYTDYHNSIYMLDVLFYDEITYFLTFAYDIIDDEYLTDHFYISNSLSSQYATVYDLFDNDKVIWFYQTGVWFYYTYDSYINNYYDYIIDENKEWPQDHPMEQDNYLDSFYL